MKLKPGQLKSNLPITISYWLQHHIECNWKSLARHLKNPFSFVITVLMIAIAFTIPAAIYILFHSADNLAERWSKEKQITIFLKADISTEQANNLRDQLLQKTEIFSAYVIDRDQALEDFKQHSNLGAIVDSLPANPIPHLVVVNLADTEFSLDSLKNLQAEFSNFSIVEQVQFDLIWIQRLQALLELTYRLLWIITALLLAAVGLIITNVIRWEVASRHDEIEIIRLVGGTDAYVRRPFLYSGFWLGLTGAGVAVLVVTISAWIVGHAVTKLAVLYDSEFQLSSISPGLLLLMLVTGGVFGAAGAWIAVRQRLRQFS